MEDSPIPQFLERLTRALIVENAWRYARHLPPLNVAYLLAPLEKHLDNTDYAEFVQFLEAGPYDLHFKS